jgi:hypothetical protein
MRNREGKMNATQAETRRRNVMVALLVLAGVILWATGRLIVN